MTERTEKLEALLMQLIELSEKQDEVQKQIDALKAEIAKDEK